MLLLAPVTTSPASSFDTPVSEFSEGDAHGPLDRMSLNQMMRLSTLPKARLRELQCAGVSRWAGSQAWPVFALDASTKADFESRVANAVAHDLEMERELAVALIDQYAEEVPYHTAKGDLDSWRHEVESDCTDILSAIRARTYQLSPLAEPTVVDTTLATCYARYSVAAERTDGEEADGLLATAAKAEALALNGKQGEALAKAKAALAAQIAAERAAGRGDENAEMMQMVICIPALEGAKRAMEK